VLLAEEIGEATEQLFMVVLPTYLISLQLLMPQSLCFFTRLYTLGIGSVATTTASGRDRIVSEPFTSSNAT